MTEKPPDDERSARLVESLGAVAIAVLDHAVPLSGTIVKHLVAAINTHPDPGLRELDRAVVSSVKAWALRDDVEGVDVGLALAVDTMARHGLTLDELANLDYDAKKAADRVLSAAHRSDRRWGRRKLFRAHEDYHKVAERAIRSTYVAMVERLARSQGAILPSIKAVRLDLERIGTQVDGAVEQLGQLADQLVGAATVGEVMAYLRTRIEDWDEPERNGQIPSVLARRLTARTEEPGGVAAQFLTEEAALSGQRMLVVLGGPGSGKSWLAYRYAREAAQTALSALESDIDIDQVELPVFTTWHQWSKTDGSARSSVVDASFESRLGHRDVENEAVNRRVRLTLKDTSRLLMVIDSLDESAQVPAEKGNLLRALAPTNVQHHRVVVTSRLSDWKAIQHRLPESYSARVVELQGLDQEDVAGFIAAWFEHDRARGDQLTTQLQHRPDLAQAAVSPLTLMFYCRIVESGDGVETLPTRRHKLYSTIVRNSFHRFTSTKPTAGSEQSMARREWILADWAWRIGASTTDAGLGSWGETLTLEEDSHDAALDEIAPRVQFSDTGTVTRRFQHRTFLEHFVAEYVAGLDTDTAFETLRPHLWYDPEWRVVAPAAIAAHNRRHPGDLLDRFLDMINDIEVRPSPLWSSASREIDKILTLVLTESEPAEWSQRHQEILRQRRTVDSRQDRDIVARTAQWTDSNGLGLEMTLDDLVSGLQGPFDSEDERTAARAAVLASLLSERRYMPRELVHVLPDFADSENVRTEIRKAVLAALPDASGTLGELVELLLALEPSSDERAEARASVLTAISGADMFRIHDLVAMLPDLVDTENERAEVRTTLLAAVPGSSMSTVRDLVSVLPDLAETDNERADVRVALLAAVPSTNSSTLPHLVGVLLALRPSRRERGDVRTIVLATLPDASRSLLRDLAGNLSPLVETQKERAEVQAALASALPNSTPTTFPDLLKMMLDLVKTQEERAEARAALLASLRNPNPSVVREALAALVSLGPSPDEKAESRTAVLTALPGAEPPLVRELIGTLSLLDPSPDEKAQSRTAVLATLRTDPGMLGELVDVLLSLDPSPEERAEARAVLLSAFPEARASLLRDLAVALPALVETGGQRAEARTALLAALPRTEPSVFPDLVEVLLQFVTSATERAEVRAGLRAALPAAEPSILRALVEVLWSFDPSPEERDEARTALLVALPDANSFGLCNLLDGLLALGISRDERAEARRTLLAALPGAARADVDDLVALLPPLIDNADERAEVLDALLAALPNAEPYTLSSLVETMPTLIKTSDEQTQARTALLAALPDVDPHTLRGLMEAVSPLIKTPDERAQARKAVLAALSHTSPSGLYDDLVETLPQLVKTEEDRTALRREISAITVSGADSLGPTLRRLLDFEDWISLMTRSMGGVPGPSA